MLTFSLNNNYLLLSKETSVRITKYNPACFFESVPGDTGLGIDIPVNDHNRTYLGNPERFQKKIATSTREFKNFEISFSGQLLLKGSLIIQSASKENYSGWLRSDVGNLGAEHREKYIYDIDSFNEDKIFDNKANYDSLTDPYGCPEYYNPHFFYDKGRKITLTRKIANPDYVKLSAWQDIWQEQLPAYIDDPYETEPLTESFRKSSLWMVNALNPDKTVKLLTGGTEVEAIHEFLFVSVVSPMLFLNFILKTLLKDANFYIDQNFIADDPDLRKLILYSSFDITNIFFTTDTQINTVFYSMGDFNFVDSYSVPINTINRDYNGTFKYRNLLPKIKLADFFLSVQNLLNVFFFFRMNSKVDIIDRESLFTVPYINIQQFMVNNWSIDEQKDSTLRFSFDHDQNDISFSDHFKDIEDIRNDIIGSRATLEDMQFVLNPKLGDIVYIRDANIYLKYSWITTISVDEYLDKEVQTDTLGWEYLASGFQNGFYRYGKQEIENIDTKFSTLMGDQTVNSYQRGNMNALKYDYQKFTPRLLFYHGNNRATNKTDNLQLDWEHEQLGLIVKRYPKWKRFWSTRLPVTGEADFPLNMLIHVYNNIYKRHRTEEGEFFIEKIETNFNLNSIGISKISSFKI